MSRISCIVILFILYYVEQSILYVLSKLYIYSQIELSMYNDDHWLLFLLHSLRIPIFKYTCFLNKAPCYMKIFLLSYVISSSPIFINSPPLNNVLNLHKTLPFCLYHGILYRFILGLYNRWLKLFSASWFIISLQVSVIIILF